MNTASRGIRNAFRNVVRTISIVIILGISIGLALIMLVARQAVQQKITSVQGSIGNTVSIAPAGIRGFSGGGTPLTTTQLAKVEALPHVTSVKETLNDRLTTSDTNLVSSIVPGDFGQRQQRINSQSGGSGFNPGGFGGGGLGGGSVAFSLPVTVVGTTDTSSLNATSGGGTLKIISGQQINGSEDKNVAIVGKDLATKNNLKAGSTFTAYGTTITVSGIYDAGNTFSNSQLIMSLPAVQRLSSQPGAVTSAVATIDSIGNLDTATTEITNSLGSGTADVTSSVTQANNAIQPLQSIKTITLYSLLGAVIAGSIIILLTMVMIVRERRREIGVIKAIGASNTRVILQFMTEAVTLTLMGAVIGLGIGIAGSSPVTKLLVTNSTATSTGPGGFGGRPGGGFFARQFGGGGAFNIRSVHAVVGWDILLYGLLAAILIAVIGSAIASGLIAKVRPAEVMRTE